MVARGLGWPGGDRLSRALRQSTMGAQAVDGRVRDGIGSGRLAKATRPAKPTRFKGVCRTASLALQREAGLGIV